MICMITRSTPYPDVPPCLVLPADGATTQHIAAHLSDLRGREADREGDDMRVVGVDIGVAVIEKARRVQAARAGREDAEMVRKEMVRESGSAGQRQLSEAAGEASDSRGSAAGVKCRFEVADAWNLPGLLALAPGGAFTVIYVDVGGEWITRSTIRCAGSEYEARNVLSQLLSR